MLRRISWMMSRAVAVRSMVYSVWLIPSALRLGVFGAAKTDVRLLPARGNGGGIPDHILRQRVVVRFSADLVPGLVGARRGVELNAEVLHGLITRRHAFLD